MPELPEVETLKRELGRSLKKKTIRSTEVLWAKTVFPLTPKDFQEKISGKSILNIRRQAKMLIFDLRGPLSLVFHLKMTGQLIFVPKIGKKISGGHPAPQDEVILPNRHTRVIFSFNDGSLLYFNDLRKFGWSRLVDDVGLKNLNEKTGVEPLTSLFTPQFFSELFRHFPKRTVKKILMDQRLIAGIGNIYADEAAFLSGILPERKAGSLTEKEINKLRQSITEVLKLSIKMKGTSSRNYRRSTGELGGFVPHLYVYGRAGKPCKTCGKPIQKTRHNGRGTHFCPFCQK